MYRGQRRIPSEIAADIAEHVSDDALTPRETEVLSEVAAGFSNKSVAERLGIADETVKIHMKRILSKLSARDRTQAVMIAVKRGIITP